MLVDLLQPSMFSIAAAKHTNNQIKPRYHSIIILYSCDDINSLDMLVVNTPQLAVLLYLIIVLPKTLSIFVSLRDIILVL